MPTEDPTLGADATSSMPTDPMATDPTMGADATTPDMGGEGSTPEADMPQDDTTPTDDVEMPEADGEETEDNSISRKIDDLKQSLNPDHLEAWAKYGESMAAEESDEASMGDDMGDEAEAENPLENPITPQAGPAPAPMAESVVFSKGQLRKLSESRLRRK